MAARILDGTATGAAIRAELRPRVEALQARCGRPPGLGIVLAGHDPASEIYVRNKLKTAGDAGIRRNSSAWRPRRRWARCWPRSRS